MNFNLIGLIVILAVCEFVASNKTKKAVDCRKFVFAPICRGVAAKRNSLNVLENDYTNQKSMEIPDSYYMDVDPIEYQDNDRIYPSKQQELEYTLKRFYPYFKFLQKMDKINRERYNSYGYEDDNL